MDKVEKILEKYKIYLGVKDVKLVVRPYKTRDAFTNLSSSPPTIYLNEYLIDDEEVVEYLLLRELIHIKLHMYPPMRYGTPSMSYAAKFNSVLHFFIPKEKVEEIRERIVKKMIEVNQRLQRPFSSFLWGLPAPPRAPRGSLVTWARGGKKRLIRLQVLPYRPFFTGLISPVGKSLWGCTCRRTSVDACGDLIACRSFLTGLDLQA